MTYPTVPNHLFSDGPEGRALSVPARRNTALRAVAKLVVVSVANAVLICSVLTGCASSTPAQPTLSEDQKQDAILNDPMNYKPQIDRSVTGDDGNMVHTGRGLGNDLNDVLNP